MATDHARLFTRFAAVGGIFYIAAVLLNAYAIDVAGFDSTISSLVVLGVLFIAKYQVYRMTDIVNPGFWRYCLVNILITLAASLIIGYLVKSGLLNGTLATATALAFFFVLRYVVLFMTRVIRNPA
ncbi:MAG: hypothetical protein KJO54_08870 [Gammaproteobacteria bacterium]|nr:hypothetical protein [Gammaproteobacteria bacterium]NNF60353.1 hypothetical protein [Gammaproteobacteria bacterium]NNM20603.1 hypothetical protein [Gammaproteobacteria bacterium]